ncbi:MAG: hypothetical protein JO331_15280 [Verrucomicrobia bacterium]|nr:hypothetical protein [Verrucomicrobiota bacterium]
MIRYAMVTAAYWAVGRRIVDFEQQGKERPGYGEALLKNLAFNLTIRFGRWFGVANLTTCESFS